MDNRELVEFVKGIKFSLIQQRGGITFHPLAGPSLYKIFSSGIREVIPGEDYDPALIIYHDNQTNYLIPEIKSKSVGLKALEMLKENPDFLKKFRKIFSRRSRRFIRYMKKATSDLKNASDKKLLKIYRKYLKKYYQTCLYGEPVAFALRHELGRYLEGIISNKIKDKKKVREYYLLLTTPRELSFINTEDMMLNRIVKEIKENKEYSHLFSLSTERLSKAILKYHELLKKIEKHKDDFFRVPHDYLGNIWNLNDFIEKIKNSLEREIKTNEREYLKDLIKKQENLFKQLIGDKIISKKQKRIFIASQDAMSLLDLKKEKLTQTHYYINLLFKEVASRKKADFWNIIFLMENELEDFLDGKIDEKILKKRRESSIYVCTKQTVYCLVDEAKEILNHCFKDSSQDSVEISGICASAGNIIAPVCVLKSPRETNKVRQGDIIVTGMTTPEYVPALKKASAIITDEGGITCHAAIVSRELGIPCIIGTKIATKVLKDGNLVEIHGATGVIKILKK
jgi:phosphohistidine swiveling domain-containing protein